MLPAHFQDVTGDVVTMLGNIVTSCYALGSLVVLVFYRVLLGIALSVVFIISKLILYFALDSCTKLDCHTVTYRQQHRESLIHVNNVVSEIFYEMIDLIIMKGPCLRWV